jgi:TPR repeat protein
MRGFFMNLKINIGKKIILLLISGLFSIHSFADELFDKLLETAKSGDPEAQYRVAKSYHLSHKEEASIYWHRQAVNQLHEKSLYALSKHYCSGSGVQKNIEVCYAMVSLVAGDVSKLNEVEIQFSVRPLANEYLEKISQRMSDSEIQNAKALASELLSSGNVLAVIDDHLEKAKKQENADR